jgi:AcrR family transcriptional regulator
MPRGKRRTGGRSALVRAAVLDAALHELAALGYARMSMEGIARRAGVNKTTLYRRWGSREALLVEALLERGEERVPIPDTGSLRDDLLAIARAVVASSGTPEIRAVIRAVASQDEDSPLLEASRQFWAERFALDGQVVERAIERGEACAETDPKTVIEMILGPIYFRLLLSGEAPDDEFVVRIVDLAVAAARRQPNRRAAKIGSATTRR